MGKVAADKKGHITVDTLAALRTRLNTLKASYKMSQARVEETKILAYNLEDIVLAKNSTDERKIIRWTLFDKDSTAWEYNWHIKYKPVLNKLAAILFFILSAFSFLGVICSMHGVSHDVSIYYSAVHRSKSTVGGIALFILVTLGYTVYITFWALFQMKIAGNMELVPHRTTPTSLSFNVRMVARLAAPLAFFYLGWIVENGITTGSWQYNDAPATYTNVTVSSYDHTTNTTVYKNETVAIDHSIFMPSAFSNFYQLQSVGAIQSTFGTIFPILLFCVLFLFLINAFNRLLVLIKMEEYQFGAGDYY